MEPKRAVKRYMRQSETPAISKGFIIVMLSLSQSAKATSVSKATVHRAIKSGKLSATRNEDGNYRIDPAELDRFDPTLFLFDRIPGGVGLAPALFRQTEELVERTHTLVSSCACRSGCPGCIGPMSHASPDTKEAARRILGLLRESS